MSTEREKRLETLCRAAFDLIQKCNTGPYVKDVCGETAYYDGAECDGLCLRDDIAIELELYDENGLLKRPITEADVPKYLHDNCGLCRFLGRYTHPEDKTDYDLYFCPQARGMRGTVIARFGDNGPDYFSGLFEIEDKKHPLDVAHVRAINQGYLP